MTDSIEHMNQCLARLEGLLLQELAWQAAWKVDMIGIDYLKSKKIEGNTVEKLVESCIKEIKAGGIAGDVGYTIGGLGILLTLNVTGCVHIPMEARLKKDGIKPFICPVANMILDRILELLKYESYFVADLKIDESQGKCVVRCAIYENEDKIELVSDWSKTATNKG